MKRVLSLLAMGMLGTLTAVAQTSGYGQAGASAQTQTSAQANKSGAQASGSGAASTTASANAGSSAASISSGTKIDATLASSLDAKKSKVGDRVEARTTQDVKQDGKVVLKKGTRLVGHVTQAQARAAGQTQSQLGVAFDHAILAGGQEVPFNATIQALAAARSSAAAATGAEDTMPSGGAMGGMQGSARGNGGGLVGGVTSTAGAATGTVVNTASSVSSTAGGTAGTTARSTGAVGGLTSTGRIASDSSGVFGLEGLSLDSAATSATQGSLIVSQTKNVRLESGTQILLSASGQAQ